MAEIEAYATAAGLRPGTVLQKAKAGSGDTWRRWQEGGLCGIARADRIRSYMAENPPTADGSRSAA